jgi:hypothetical protein
MSAFSRLLPIIRIIITTIFLMALSGPVAAQSADDYHPFLSDTFRLGIGAFWPQIDLTARVDGSEPGKEIDFDEAFNISDNQTSASLDFRWRFGEKWSFWGQVWGTDNSGKATLEEDYQWQDVVFKQGTFAETGVDLEIVRAFFGRKFDLAPHHEFGLGLGVHWMNLETFIEGEIIIDDDSTDFQRVSTSADFPLPNLGAWYLYSWSPKWVLEARLDWLSVTIGDYSGSIWDAQLGINYQPFKHVGFGLSYKTFQLDVDIDKSTWRGSAQYDQHGPLLAVTATW